MYHTREIFNAIACNELYTLKKLINIDNSIIKDVLIHASRVGYYDIVDYLSDIMVPNINYKNNKGNTALMYSANRDIIKLLLNKGADINVANNNGDNFLLFASRRGNWNNVKFIVDYGLNINYKNNNNESALLITIKYRNWNIAEFLIEREAIIDIPDKNGNTELLFASKYGNVEFVNLLLNKRANPHHRNNIGQSAFILACKYFNSQIIKILLDRNVDINCYNNHGNNALMSMIKFSSKSSEWLLEHSKDGEEFWRHWLYWTCDRRIKYSSHIKDFLFDNGVILENINLNHQNNKGITLLMMLCKNYSLYSTFIHLLLNNYNVNLNLQNNKGETALMLLCKDGYFPGGQEIVKLLLDKGADINLQDRKQRNALLISIRHMCRPSENGRSVSSHLRSTEYGQEQQKIIDLLLERDAYIGNKNKYANNCFHYFMMKRWFDFATILLETGVNINCWNYYNKSPLYVALENEDLEVIKFILNHNININMKNYRGETPLVYLLKHFDNPRIDIVQLLLNHGADPTITDYKNNTSLIYATINKHYNIIKLLLNHFDLR